MTTSRKVGLVTLALAVLTTSLAARAAEPDKLLPSDSQFVVVVNVRQILDSPLIKQFALEKMKEELKKNDEARKALQAAGLDPFKDVDTITAAGVAGLGGGKDDKKGVVVVRGRFDPAKIRSTVEEYAKAKGEDLKIEAKGGTPAVYEVRGKEGKEPMFVAFADNKTMVVSPLEGVTRKAAGGDAGALNADLRKALGKVGGKESLYFALAVTDEMKKGMAQNPKMKEVAPKLESVTGSVDLTDAFAANVSVHTNDPKAAGQIQNQIKQSLPLAGLFAAGVAGGDEKKLNSLQEVIKQINVETAGNTVNVSLKIDQKTLEEIGKAPKGPKDQKDQ